jgi:hypothetical protein
MLRAPSLLAALTLLLAPSSEAAVFVASPASLSPTPGNACTAFFEDGSESRIGLLCHNDPINKSDPMGLEFRFPEDRRLRATIEKQLKDISGADKRLSKMVDQLAKSKNVVEIKLPDKKGNSNSTRFQERDATNGKGTGSVIRYDPSNTNVHAKLPIVSLVHELRHAQEADLGVIDRGATPTGLPVMEQNAVQRGKGHMRGHIHEGSHLCIQYLERPIL